ncbi:hypothetical protein [Nocardia carnea]|uniref:hypothetical protein n=1 Tax=Nocardia carnea TaxID=37328 RepID=UPI002454291B|nr:hypothetical protein [Nocardia carnea]
MNKPTGVSLDQVTGKLMMDVSQVVRRLARTEADWYRVNSSALDRAAQGWQDANSRATLNVSTTAHADPVTVSGKYGASNDRFPPKTNAGPEPTTVNSETARLRRPFIGLGDDLDEIVAHSPTLTARFNDIQRRGWVVRYGDEYMMRRGEAMRMGYADLREKTIVIDDRLEGDPREVTRTFNHEVGHAYGADKIPDEPSIQGQTRAEWSKKCTDQHLNEEGRAILSEYRPLDEISTSSRIFIPMSGSGWEDYEFIGADYEIGAVTEKEAISKISRQLGECIVEGTDKTYREMLMGEFGDIYDSIPQIQMFRYGPGSGPDIPS